MRGNSKCTDPKARFCMALVFAFYYFFSMQKLLLLCSQIYKSFLFMVLGFMSGFERPVKVIPLPFSVSLLI